MRGRPDVGVLRRGIVGVQHAMARHEMLQSGGIWVGAAEGFSAATMSALGRKADGPLSRTHPGKPTTERVSPMHQSFASPQPAVSCRS